MTFARWIGVGVVRSPGLRWRRSRARAAVPGPGTAAIRAAPSTRRSIRSTRATSRTLRIAWRRPAVDPQHQLAQLPTSRHSNNFRVDAADDRRRALQPERHRAGRSVPSRAPARRSGSRSRLPTSRGRACAATARAASRTGPTASDRRLFVVRGEYLIALDPRTGKPIPDVRRQGPRRTCGRASARAPAYIVDRRAAGLPRRRHRRRRHRRRDADRPMQGGSRRATCRRSTCAPASRAGRFTSIPRPGEVGNDTWENDSWAYSGKANLWSLISADEELGLAYLPLTSSDQRHVRRASARQQPVRQHAWCASKCLTGERVWHYQIVHHDLWDYDLPAAPILADITRRRTADQGGRAGHQAGVRVRVRSHDRQAGVADRRAAGAAVRHAGRADVADAAVPDQAAAVRSAGRHGRRSDRLHAGAARGGARAREAVPDRSAVHAAVDSRRRARTARRGTIQLPGSVGGADWQGARVRSRDRHAVRRRRSPVRSSPTSSRAIRRRPNLDYVSGHARVDRRAAGAAAAQAAVRAASPRSISNKGEHVVDGAERRRSARPSAAEAAQPAAARQSRAAARRS